MLPPFLCLLARPRKYNPYYHVGTPNLTSRVPVRMQCIDRAIIPFTNLAHKCRESTFNESHYCYSLFVSSIKYLDRAVSLRRGYTIRCFREYFDERDMPPALIGHLCRHGCTNLLREMDWEREFTSRVYAHGGLYYACENGDIVTAKLLADKFALISELNDTNMYAEIKAAKEIGHATVVKRACMNGHLNTAKWFAENFPTSHEYTRGNRIEIIEKTLSEGFLDVTRWLITMCQLNDAEKEMCERRIHIIESRAATTSEEETPASALDSCSIKGNAIYLATLAAIIGTLTTIVMLT